MGALHVEPRTLLLSDQNLSVARTKQVESRLAGELSALKCLEQSQGAFGDAEQMGHVPSSW
ncbi:hypothetical protein AQI88_14200 [Streptomyces cellostaticus]|uniref:Uncharacterized protein n=1 Tax=Streptomyces cellostaticus TaxID=67285 RepID=A0A101NMX6_9ACTN|nr:hypothetical protein AQI88_14200 [Streptomyces cellostaticus]